SGWSSRKISHVSVPQAHKLTLCRPRWWRWAPRMAMWSSWMPAPGAPTPASPWRGSCPKLWIWTSPMPQGCCWRPPPTKPCGSWTSR
ncbi:unnamed protein product, partial [Effrenium voratum]